MERNLCFWQPRKKVPKILYDQAFAWFRKKRYIASIYYSPKNIVNINSGFRYNIVFDNGDIIEGEGYYPNYEYIRLEYLKTLIDLYENNLKMIMEINKNLDLTEFLVPIDIAIKLKEIGFDEPTPFYWDRKDIMIEGESDFMEEPTRPEYYFCLYLRETKFHYNEGEYISTPTYEQVFKWFRDKGLHGTINNQDTLKSCNCEPKYEIEICYYHNNTKNYYDLDNLDDLDTDYEDCNIETYEEARLNLLNLLIKIYEKEYFKV